MRNMALETKAAEIQEKDIVNKEDGVCMSVKSKFQDPEKRRKLFLWMCLPIGMLNVGILDSLVGATLLDLQILTWTDEQMTALFITSYNLGYLLGSLFGGYCHGKLNSYLLLTVCCVMAGGTNIAIPYCSTFLLMFIIHCIVGFFLGIVLCIINAEHMQIWGTRGEALLQLINCTYALGGVIGPVMASPFITERDKENTTSTHQNVTSDYIINHNITFTDSISYTVACDNFTYHNMTIDNFINHNLTFDNFINLTLECHNHTETDKSPLPRTTKVHYAFLIGGIISVLVAIPFFITLLKFSKSSSHGKERGDSDIPDRNLPLLLKVFLAGLLFAYYLFYCSIEITFASYLLVFIVEHFENIGTHEAAYIMTYYWALFATGRFISIFTSKYLSAEKLLCIHLSMIASSIAGFMASALYSRFDVVTVFACLMGLSFSATFAAGVSWTEAKLMKVTGPISAVILAGSSTGPMVVPFVVGHLMQYVTNMWFCYAIMIVFILAVSVLTILVTLNRYYVNKKYGELGTVSVQEKLQGLPDIVVQTTYL